MIVSSPNVGPDLNRFGPIGLVVVQSTSLCNLDCSYCYLPDRQKKRVFDLDLLPLLMQRILESPYAGRNLPWCGMPGSRSLCPPVGTTKQR